MALCDGLRVLIPGAGPLIQDLGRPGLAALGVPASGALDRGSLRRANRIVGNPEDCAGLELLGGSSFTTQGSITLACSGAYAQVLMRTPGGAQAQELPWHRSITLPTGTELSFGWPRGGLRMYLAVRGGFATEAVLGSRSVDQLSGFGHAALAGDLLPIGPRPDIPIPPVDVLAGVEKWPGMGDPTAPLSVVLGPRATWFTPAAVSQFLAADWRATARTNRVGMRLAGPALDRQIRGELPSEGLRPGSIQVPPDGQPVILLADGPVTGGYPVIAVVVSAHLDRLAQVRPGMALRFRPVEPPQLSKT